MPEPADPPAQPPDAQRQPPIPQPPVQQQPVPGIQAVEHKRFRLALFLPAVLAAIAALLVGIGIGAWGGGGWGDRGGVGRTTAAPAPAVTVTVTVEATMESGGASPVQTEKPSIEPTQTRYNPKPTDFTIGIKLLTKKCYGELGCDVNFQIIPSYVGGQSFPAKGTTEVTYEVTGGKETITNTFEVDGDGTMTFDEEESAKMASSSSKLVAKVISVTYNEFG